MIGRVLRTGYLDLASGIWPSVHIMVIAPQWYCDCNSVIKISYSTALSLGNCRRPISGSMCCV